MFALMDAPGSRRAFVTLSRQLAKAAVPVKDVLPKYRVAIVGGGSAGVSVASQLKRKMPGLAHEIAVIEPRDTHLYQPYWTMVGGLGLDIKKSGRPMEMVMPLGVQWIKDSCSKFDPENNKIRLASGQEIEYDVLVVASGLVQNFHLIPGLQETMGKNGVASIYSKEFAPDVWKNIQGLSRGRAIFTNPATAVNCGGAPQKICYLAECAWSSRGVRSNIDIEFLTATPGVFGCPSYRVELEKIMSEKGIMPQVKTNLVEVDGDAKLATFVKEGGELVTKPFDFMHVTPPMSAPDFVKNSPLANTTGYVDVDKHTCQHNTYPNVFSLGDCSSLPTSKTYSAIASEAPVVVHNVKAMLEGKSDGVTASYDGYTACPILLGGNKLMLAEFNGYSMDATPSFYPMNQGQGWWPFFLMKRYVFEEVYWHFMPLGRWYGKYTIFEPPLQHKLPEATASIGVFAAPRSQQAALQEDVTVKVGAGSSNEAAETETLNPEVLGVSTPFFPGDVSLSGIMSADAVAKLAPRYKGWLYLNKEDHPNFCKKELEAANCKYEVVHVPAPALGSAPTAETATAVLAAFERLPRPLMVQCTSGNRSGAAFLLWLAKQEGRNAESAGMLAKDLDLAFFTTCSECGPVRDWVLNQLASTNEEVSQAAATKTKEGPGYVIKQLFDTQGSSTFTYLIGCSSSQEALLIDPVLGMQERDLAVAEELGFKIKYVVNTHCHADHITSGSAIKKLHPEVQTMIAEASGAAADVKLRDGDEVKFGEYALRAVATPGHTDGCMTFVLDGPGEPRAAFTGDTLLIRGCGRTDFQAGNSSLLYDSVHEKIFSLPGDTKIYPGHDYKGRNLSTVEEERRFNPRLTKSREEFAKLMSELNLPRPTLMDSAVPANMVCGAQE